MQNFLDQLILIYFNFNYSNTFYIITIISVLLVSISKSGFGGGLGGLGVPIILFVLPAKEALAVFLPLVILTDLWVVYVWRSFTVHKILIVMCIGGLTGQLLAWSIFEYLNDSAIAIIIAILAILTSINYLKNFILLNKTQLSKTKLNLNYKKGIFWCSLSGFSSFISLTGSIPAQVFLIPMRLERQKFVATMGFYFFFINFIKIPFFLELSIFSLDTIALSIFLLPIIPIGIFLGKWLNNKLNDKVFYHLIHAALFICGLNLILKEFQ